MVYRKRKLTAPELKYTEPVSSIQEYRVAETLHWSPASAAEVNENKDQRAFFNKWWTFAPPYIYVPTGGQPTVTQQTSSTPFASNNAFEQSVFVPGQAGVGGIKQGTGAHDRIGRSVAVMKDTWRWTISIPNKQTYLDSRGQPNAVISGLGGRPFRVRLLCVFRRVLDTPGDFIFKTNEIFDDKLSLDTTLKADTNGYSVVVDKRFTLGSLAAEPYTDPAGKHKAYATDNTGGPLTRSVKVSMPKYELQWADDNANGRFTPETSFDIGGGGSATLPGSLTHNGVTKGTFQWFCFVEDEFSDVISNSATIHGVPYAWDGLNVPGGGVNFQIERNVKYIDP